VGKGERRKSFFTFKMKGKKGREKKTFSLSPISVLGEKKGEATVEKRGERVLP